MSLTADKRHQFDREEFYGDFAVTLGWQQNFNQYRLSSYFLNRNGKMTVGSNAASGQTAFADVRASDLGLSATFTGCAWLCPKYADFIADFDLYLAWDEFVQGLWTQLRFPFVHTRWNAGLGTSVTAAGGTYYSYCSDTTTCQDTYVVDTKGNAIPLVYSGCCALSSALLGNCSFGDAPRLTAGKMVNCRRTANGLDGIRLALGYDFVRRERGSLGLALDVVFPVANQLAKNNCCCDLFIFDPSVGGQHAWKVGGVLRGQYMLWDRDENERIDMYLDGRAYGVFNGQTTRLLGLNAGTTACTPCCNTLFNQYLLLKKYTVSGTTATYAGLERAANLLKARVKYNKALCEGQITVMFQYHNGGFVGALGYNFFGRSAENLCICNMCCPCGSYYYVIKGDLPVYQPDGTTDAGFYSPTDSNINSTGTAITTVDATTVQANAIDFSTCSATACCGRINLCPAAHPKYISNTIFGNIGYNWEDVDWKPYIGLIGKVDLGAKNTALRLWGVYLKGGFCF